MEKEYEATSGNSAELTKELGERTLDYQVVTLREKGNTAIQLVKVNLLIATFLIAILEFGNTTVESPDTIQKVALSFFPIVISTTIALIARFFSRSINGLNSNGLSLVHSSDKIKLEGISEAYILWVGKNEKQMKKVDWLLGFSVAFTTCTLGYLMVALFYLTG